MLHKIRRSHSQSIYLFLNPISTCRWARTDKSHSGIQETAQAIALMSRKLELHSTTRTTLVAQARTAFSFANAFSLKQPKRDNFVKLR
ncbi:MAG: hypothetical protein HC907_35940 [Richelia sp. SM1_7_0]|nr:hypothetical protein [Richelia sp. SM1_7_0]NJQ97038.1 hypothetical protein [Hydrococcus sp. CSU_1_8]